jgi:hypothetical protein
MNKTNGITLCPSLTSEAWLRAMVQVCYTLGITPRVDNLFHVLNQLRVAASGNKYSEYGVDQLEGASVRLMAGFVSVRTAAGLEHVLFVRNRHVSDMHTEVHVAHFCLAWGPGWALHWLGTGGSVDGQSGFGEAQEPLHLASL